MAKEPLDSDTSTLATDPTEEDDHSRCGLSARAIEMLKDEPAVERFFTETGKNLYDPIKNPQGIIPFGLAENKIATQILRPKLEEISSEPEDTRVYSYGTTIGEKDFRDTLKLFLEHYFHPVDKIDVGTLFVTNGASAALEAFAFALAEPGEYIMVPRPCYFRLFYDFYERARVRILPVEQPNPSPSSKNRYALDVTLLEEAYHRAAKEGKVVRAVHITNPSNPTGDVYSVQELTDLLSFAHRHNLHVIANELYGLGVYDPEVTFTSILALPHPDPTRVHFIWSVSKDLGLSGFRISVQYMRNPGLVRYLHQVGGYLQATVSVEEKLRKLLGDFDYMDNEFIPEMRQRILSRYRDVKDALEGCGGRVHQSPATIFRWLDLSSFLPAPDFEGESRLFERLLSGGVFLVAGGHLHHMVPGWFRMVVSMEDHVHAEGMRRLVSLLNTIRAEKEQELTNGRERQ